MTQSGVQRHVKTRHGNEKKTASYQCTLCDKALTRSTGVTLHMQANHPTNEMPIHSCEKCGYKSRMKFALTRHVQRVHDRVKRTECYFCGKKFFDFKDLVSHYPYFRKIRHVVNTLLTGGDKIEIWVTQKRTGSNNNNKYLLY